MSILKPALLLATVAALAGAPMSASAQTQPAPSPSPTAPPPAVKPDPAPMPPAARPAPAPTDKSVTAPKAADPLMGLSVFSSDGSKLGTIQSVKAGPDGKATAIHFKTGGFLGIGGKIVEVAEGKFTKTGDRVQLSMTADEVSKLPEVKDNS